MDSSCKCPSGYPQVRELADKEWAAKLAARTGTWIEGYRALLRVHSGECPHTDELLDVRARIRS